MFLSTWVISCFLLRYRLVLENQHRMSLRTDIDVQQLQLFPRLEEENTGRDEHAAEDDPLEKENTLNKIHQHMISMNLLTKTKQWLNRSPFLLHPESLHDSNIPCIHNVDPHPVEPGSGALWEKYMKDGDWTVL